MQTTLESLLNGYNLEGSGVWSFKFGDGYELTFEPLLNESQMYVALYKNEELLTDKVVVKPGKL